jgi:hypothetical protein
MLQEFVPSSPLQTAVLFLVFNRPDTTKRVFEAIRRAKPPRLYVASDGPREGKPGEVERVKAVRAAATAVDWPCEVKMLFRDKNLGCKHAVSSAITWFFENEEQGIILEDDCLPSQSFFWYCEELLNKYKQDENIYVISGDNSGPEAIGMKEGYGFCKYPLIWGWATWASVWEKYDVNITDWPKNKDQLIKNISNYSPTKRFWAKLFEDLYGGKIDTWDYQLTYLLLSNSAKCIVPRVNLISNIGFGDNATHTLDSNSKFSNRIKVDIELPIGLNKSNNSEKDINNYYDKKRFFLNNIFYRLFYRLFLI